MTRRVYVWGSVLLVAILIWAGNRAWQAHLNLVTLDVQDADVRDVVRKIEWQTWETIVVNKEVKGKVTLNVRKVPLEEVMGIIGEQTSSRFSTLYPIFSKGNSVVKLRKLIRGDLASESAGWTNYNAPGFGGFGGGRGGPGGGFGGGGTDTVRTQNTPVSLTLSGKDLSFAALALARFSQAQVIPEDGASGIISLQLTQVPFTEAVAKVAKQASRKWEVLYALQGRPDFGGGRDGDFGGGGRNGGRGGDGGGRGFGRGDGEGDTNWQARAEARQEERTAGREREVEARLATMTPEEQAKAKEEQQKFEEMRNLPPEQRQAAFEAMRNDPKNQQRGENRRAAYLNNSSPEQRSDRTRQMMERRARRDSGQQQPPRGR